MSDTPVFIDLPSSPEPVQAGRLLVALSQRPGISLRIQQGIARKQKLEKEIQSIATYPAETGDEELPASREWGMITYQES